MLQNKDCNNYVHLAYMFPEIVIDFWEMILDFVYMYINMVYNLY